MLKLGTAKMVINPLVPVRMAGYAARTGPYEEIWQDIYTRVYSLRQGDRQILLVYADILWWNPTFVAQYRPKLSKALGIPEECVLFVASHNHSGPGTGDCFSTLLETIDAEYIAYLYSRIEEAAKIAAEDEESVSVSLHKGTCRLNVYRRVQKENGIEMAPNYDVPADDHLTVLRFVRDDGTLKGAILHYPCHANLADSNALHPDFPGVAMDMLDEENPGCITMYFQGCTADLRPNSVLGEVFVAQDFEGVKNFAQQLKKHCYNAMKAPGKLLEGSLAVKRIEMTLPLDTSKNAEKRLLAASGQRPFLQWEISCKKKDFRDYEVLEASLLEINGFAVFFLNAEVSQYYAAFARKLRPDAITTAYANGMIGYLADAKQICEGGYEPDKSALYFAVAGTYPCSTQECIEKALVMLTNDKEG